MYELIISVLGASREIVDRIYKELPIVVAVSRFNDIYSPIYISSNIHSVLKVDETRISGKNISFFDLVHIDDRPVFSKAVNEFINNPDITEFEFPAYRIVDSNGKTIWVADKKSKVYDKNGNLIAVKTNLQNINERVQFEKTNKVVKEIAKAVTEVNDFADLFYFFEKIFNDVIDVDNYFVAKIEENEYLDFVLFFDQHDKSPGKRKFKKGMTEYLIRVGKNLLLSKDDIIELNNKGEIEIIGTLPEFWAGFPIMIKDEIVAVLAVQRYSDTPFAEKDLNLIDIFANELSYALTLISQREKLIEGEKALRISSMISDVLYNISKAAGSPGNDIYTVLEVIANELNKVLSPNYWTKITYNDFVFTSENIIETETVYYHKISGSGETHCLFEVGKTSDFSSGNDIEGSLKKLLDETSFRIEDFLYRINSRKNLEESEIKFRSIIHFASEAIIIIDESGLIVDANQSVERTFGFTRKELKGREIDSLIPSGEYGKPIFNVINEQINNENQSLVKLLCKNNDDKLFPAEVSFGSWIVGDKRFYALFLHDISEKIRVENQLALSRKMEAIGELAAGIAHEINTPMQFISDNTNFIKESFESFSTYITDFNFKLSEEKNITIDDFRKFCKQKEEELDINFLMDEVPDALEQTIEGIDRVATIVKAMKEFSHPSSKEKVLTDLNKNIENAVIISKNEWKYVADVELNLYDKLPLVKCLPGEINQVLLNVTVNAAQAIEEKLGKHPKTKGKIIYSTFVEGDFAVITIEDTGIGIPKENLEKVFDPFFTTKEVGRGTGQGLAIAMDIIVNKHGGVLDVESTPNEGSKFIIKLPIEGMK